MLEHVRVLAILGVVRALLGAVLGCVLLQKAVFLTGGGVEAMDRLAVLFGDGAKADDGTRALDQAA